MKRHECIYRCWALLRLLLLLLVRKHWRILSSKLRTYTQQSWSVNLRKRLVLWHSIRVIAVYCSIWSNSRRMMGINSSVTNEKQNTSVCISSSSRASIETKTISDIACTANWKIHQRWRTALAGSITQSHTAFTKLFTKLSPYKEIFLDRTCTEIFLYTGTVLWTV
jgi:hypothetical protein